MLFQRSRVPPKNGEHHPDTEQSVLESKRNTQKFSSSWIRFLMLRLSIAKKIGYGYSLAIGIAVFGTTIGMVSGDYYQKLAYKQLTIANKQQHLLSELENTVSAVRSHPQRLVTVVGDSIWLDYETAKFFGDVKRVRTQLYELESFRNSNLNNSAINTIELKGLLKDYEIAIEAYTELIKALWQQIDTPRFKPEEIQAAQQQLSTFVRGESATNLSVKFDRLSENLSRVKRAAETQQMQANDRVKQAEVLRLQIIVVSMLLSVAIAVALAIITSRAIARPLEAVTQVARAVIQESNFDLRSPVTTEDEVGSLATSLNQLVQWVGEYTSELELARQTLEQRVEERTQELKDVLQNLQQTQAQLIQTEKMSSLGLLVSGVAHEINNPLNFISGNIIHAKEYTYVLLELLDIYQQQYPNLMPAIQDKVETIDLDFIKSDLPKLLSSMEVGTERIQKIVFSLRNSSRLEEAEKKVVNIHEGIDNTLLILNHRLKQGIEVIKKYGDLPLVPCHPTQLNQVFMNILSNAIDVLICEDSLPNKQIIIQTEKVTHNQICVKIWNNGFGIPAEIRDKLFDPFFTTKPVGKGTGLGLTICYQIIEKHNGKIEVISEPGQGTEFAIALPI
jgi:signal transduction histidine kinase